MKSAIVAALAAVSMSGVIFGAELSLTDAIRAGQRAAAVDIIAQKSADLNAAEADGSTALLWAAHENDLDLVTRLVKAGAKPNVKNQLGSTPLLEAAFNANAEMVKALLDAGADPNIAGADGQTPLMLIARTSNVEAAKLLLAKGANANATEAQRGQTPVMWAAAASQGPMVRVLLEGGAEPDAKSIIDLMTPLVSSEPRAQPRPPGGMTAMLFAVREGCMECVKALLEHGAKVDQVDPEGVTPLILSLFYAHFDVAKYLLDHGANIDKWDWWGRTPLYLAVDYNTLPHGGRPDQPSIDQTLPIDLVKYLLDRGANPNPQLKLAPPYRATGADRGADRILQTWGVTPLLRAAKAQDAAAIELLLQHGALTDLPNSQGMVPVLAAAGMGSADRDTRGNYRASDVEDRAIASLDLLLDHGVKLNEPVGPQQQVAVMGAAQWGWTKVVQHLVERGADLNVADSRGLTALDYALGKGAPGGRGDPHPETADFITAKGGKAGIPVPQAGGRPGGPAGR